MRDLLVFAIFGIAILATLKRPYVGGGLWAWISIMNPHRLSWGFIYSMPLAMIAALVTLLSMAMHKDQVKYVPSLSVVWVWLAFFLWMPITTSTAFNLDGSLDMLEKVTKIMLMMFITIMVTVEKKHIQLLIWVYAMSIGLIGLKGGLFTLISGGSYRVWGPTGSFIEGNNEIGLAFVVILPVLYYLISQTQRRWLKYFVFVCTAACALAAFGTQSRGAFLAIAIMAVFLWIKSDRKFLLGMLLLLGGGAILAFMPESWHSRMDTIKSYQEDGSAMGRINAWWMTFNLACDRFFGGGFDIYTGQLFAMYAPVPDDVHAAHSIYFQVLGEHGFVGLILYLLLGFFSWRLAGQVYKRTRGNPELDWITRFAAMAKVSILGFAVGGAFLSLAYFDLPYYLAVTLIVMWRWLDMQDKQGVSGRGRVSR